MPSFSTLSSLRKSKYNIKNHIPALSIKFYLTVKAKNIYLTRVGPTEMLVLPETFEYKTSFTIRIDTSNNPK